MNHVRSTSPEKNFSKNDVTPTIISVDDINIDSIDRLGATPMPRNHGLEREQRQ